MGEGRTLRSNHRDTIDPGKITIIRYEMIQREVRTACCMEGVGKEEAVLP